MMNGWVLSGHDATYARMGVGFDVIQLESETYKLGKEIVERGLERGVFLKKEDGAIACDLTTIGLTGEKVLLRGDGTSLYMTQDLGTVFERLDRFDPFRAFCPDQ